MTESKTATIIFFVLSVKFVLSSDNLRNHSAKATNPPITAIPIIIFVKKKCNPFCNAVCLSIFIQSLIFFSVLTNDVQMYLRFLPDDNHIRSFLPDLFSGACLNCTVHYNFYIMFDSMLISLYE